MNWIIALFGAVGVGAIVTKLLDVLWLQRVVQQSERQKWLRDQRLRVYSSFIKELTPSGGFWSSDRDAFALIAEMMLLSTDPHLLELIEGHVPDVVDTRRRLDEFTNNGTSTIEERTDMRDREMKRLRDKERLILTKLRASLLKD